MTKFWTHAAQLALILAGPSVLVGGGHSILPLHLRRIQKRQDLYRSRLYAVEGTYTVEGNKVIAREDFGVMIPSPLICTISDDGSIEGPKDTFIPRSRRRR